MDTAFGKTQQCNNAFFQEDFQQLASGNSTHGKPEVPITPDYVNLFTGPATGEGSWTFLGESLGIWPSKYRERYGRNGQRTWKSKSNQQPLDDSLVRPLPKALPVVLTGFLCTLDANVYQLQFLDSWQMDCDTSGLLNAGE